MTDTIPDLWTDDITVRVLSPLTILRAQGLNLSRRTQGIVEGHVTTMTRGDVMQHNFELVGSVLDYRERILMVTHMNERVYPARVTASPLLGMSTCAAEPYLLERLGEPGQDESDAATQEQFLEIIQSVFQSGDIKSRIQSLIARSNEIREPSATGA